MKRGLHVLLTLLVPWQSTEEPSMVDGDDNVNQSSGFSELKCLWNGFRELALCRKITA